MEPESIFIVVVIVVIVLLFCLTRRRRRRAGGAEREVKEEFTSAAFTESEQHRNSVLQVSRAGKRHWLTLL